ncbi:MAG: FecR family protein [Pseudomonadota bacterium]
MSPPPEETLDQAADWLIRIDQRQPTLAEQEELKAWRAQHPDHEQAWQAAIRIKGLLGDASNDIGREVLAREHSVRRGVLKSLIGLAVLVPSVKLVSDKWPALTADYQTAAGEVKTFELPDASHLELNTASRVSAEFAQSGRQLRLIEGEVFISTTTLPGESRPFSVTTRAGVVRALGTRFSVRDTGSGPVRVEVYQHSVEVRPLQSSWSVRVAAGYQIAFDHQQSFDVAALNPSASAWRQGRIVSDNETLGEFIEELARYRPGILRCDPAVAHLRLSGVYQLDDTDVVLNLIADTLPIRIRRVTDYWVTVVPG